VNADQYQQQVAVQDQLAAATNRLLVTIDKYPALQGTEAFRGLQSQLEGSERRIKFARKDFNSAIEAYNSYVRSFPTKLPAAIFGFKDKEGFQSVAGADKSVEIKF
jgi:LemA protein